MHLFIETRNNVLVTSQQFPNPIAPFTLSLKRRDIIAIDVTFLNNGIVEEYGEFADDTLEGQLGIKALNDFSGSFLVAASGWTQINDTTFRFVINLNTETINTAFTAAITALAAEGLSSTQKPTVLAMLEISWGEDQFIFSTNTLSITLDNDVIQGSEDAPIVTAAPSFLLLSPDTSVWTVKVDNDGILSAKK